MLSAQRKFRVSELLHEDIPSEELSRLSNGRFVCKLCLQQPVFDTINMFMVHRQGKKHQQSLLYREQKDQDLKDLIHKRQQEQASLDLQLTSAVQKPKVQTNKVHNRKPYERRHVIDVNSTCEGPVSIETTQLEALPGSKLSKLSCLEKLHPTSCGVERQRFEKITMTLGDSRQKLNRDNQGAGNQKFKIKMNQGKLSCDPEKELTMQPSSVTKFVRSHLTEQSVKYYRNRKEQEQKAQTNILDQLTQPSPHTTTHNPTKAWEFYKNRQDTKRFTPATIREAGSGSACKPTDKPAQSVELTSEVLPILGEPEKFSSNDSAVKQARLQRQLKAIGSGWKRDWDGKWVKDEEAEFDSDEEPPDVM